jgi:hypothetical protein
MFPVRDPGGQRIVGFLGRALVEAEDTPRYLNSPATALYRRGEVLYGLGADPARRALADDGSRCRASPKLGLPFLGGCLPAPAEVRAPLPGRVLACTGR